MTIIYHAASHCPTCNKEHKFCECSYDEIYLQYSRGLLTYEEMELKINGLNDAELPCEHPDSKNGVCLSCGKDI